MDITHTIFKNPKISFTTRDDYRAVYCDKYIRDGEFILIEHCFRAEKNSSVEVSAAVTMLQRNEELFNGLFPRKIPWDKDFITKPVGSEIVVSLDKKLAYNSFGDSEHIVIGKDISNFNHSADPNVAIVCRQIATKFRTIIILTAIALKNIEPGRS